MEKDDEWSGDGNSYTTEFRQYDARLGRWLSLDPEMAQFSDQTPFNFVFNNPITTTDVNGDCPDGECDEYLNPKGSRISINKNSTDVVGNDDGQLLSFANKDITYSWSDDKSGYYDIDGNQYDEGSYFSGFGSAFMQQSHNAQYRIGYAWQHPDRYLKSAFKDFSWSSLNPLADLPEYLEASAYQKGRMDGRELAGMIEGGMTFAPLSYAAPLIRTASSYISYNPTFAQYKLLSGGTRTLGYIRTTNGFGEAVFQRISVEYHHVFLTQRMQRSLGLPNWMVNNPLNVLRVNSIQHSILDSYRFQFLRRGMKSDVGLFQRYHWFYKDF